MSIVWERKIPLKYNGRVNVDLYYYILQIYHCFQLLSIYSVHFFSNNVNIAKPFYQQANIVIRCYGKHAIGTIVVGSIMKNFPFLPGSEA